MTSIKRRLVDALWRPARLMMAAIMLAGLTVQSSAQDRVDAFPSRPVTLVVPFPAGGTADLTGRIIGQALARKWNQTVVIENKAGAGGNVGAEAVARAEPNGYTLLVTPQSTLVVNQYLFPNMRFDPAKFEPVSLIVKLSNALVVGSQSNMSRLGSSSVSSTTRCSRQRTSSSRPMYLVVSDAPPTLISERSASATMAIVSASSESSRPCDASRCQRRRRSMLAPPRDTPTCSRNFKSTTLRLRATGTP